VPDVISLMLTKTPYSIIQPRTIKSCIKSNSPDLGLHKVFVSAQKGLSWDSLTAVCQPLHAEQVSAVAMNVGLICFFYYPGHVKLLHMLGLQRIVVQAITVAED
jgi:hypothetical protein